MPTSGKAGSKNEAPKSKPSKLDEYKPYIAQLLGKYQNPPIAGQRILELLAEKDYRRENDPA